MSACVVSVVHRSGLAGRWQLLFALAVALTMGQLASAFPTAGGLYHWAALLGGRGWGWSTAWFNLAGLITVLAAINVGTYRFAMRAFFPAGLTPRDDVAAQILAVLLISGSQAAINHLGIGVTARLTDFSGYWILLVATVITTSLLAMAPGLDMARLVTFENLSGPIGGNVWPAASGLGLLFAQGLLLPAYTITGFDASAHAAEETIGATRAVPWGIVRSVLVSGVAGWVFLAAVVLAAPSISEAAAEGEGAFLSILNQALPGPLCCRARRGDHPGAISLWIGNRDFRIKDGICVRSRRRTAVFASRTLGLPQAAFTSHCNLGCCDNLRVVHAGHAGLRNDHGGMHDLPLPFVRHAVRAGSLDLRQDLDHHGRRGISGAGIGHWLS